MPPEYAIDRICSVKSDVFSFGVLLLEIIAGKRNNEFLYYNEESLLFYVSLTNQVLLFFSFFLIDQNALVFFF